MLAWLETYAKTHLFYIILIVVGVVAFNSWRQEHDARLLADQKVSQNAQLVKSLEDGIASRDSALAAAVKPIQVVVAAAKTPQQVVEAVPKIAPELAPSLDVKAVDATHVQVDSQGFIGLLGKYETLSKEEAACQADYADEQRKTAALTDSVKELKKKPRFWKRVGGTIKQVALGIAAGFILAEVKR